MTAPNRGLLGILDGFAGTRVAVIGDLIADEFLYGQITRVSREAPVLILRRAESRIVPGGGGNAVANLRALGAAPIPFGCVGRDEAGRALVEYFKSARIETTHIERGSEITTTTKTRIFASLPHSNRQQILRIDREGAARPSADRLKTYMKQILPKCRGLLISDYGVGGFSTLLTSDPAIASFAASRPVTVDSRYELLAYKGLTAATPNEGEVEEALGLRIGDSQEILERAGRRMLDRLQSQAVVITRGNKGMSVFERKRKPVHIPIYGGEEIADVTGAGDTVIAAFTLALCCGASFHQAAQIANFAGGLVVMKRGTATVGIDELRDAIAEAKGEDDR